MSADFDTVVFGAPEPALNAAAVYGPWTVLSIPHWSKLASPVESASRQTLNVNPEQSGPSPPVLGSSWGSFGESSRSLSFQQPPGSLSSYTSWSGWCLGVA